ncbi:MAG: DUF559 domain-containing protein [Fimbriimonadaceae bacterium]|nr:DUF559 domain-containing protein [Fimbriimonadaceae bacterium]
MLRNPNREATEKARKLRKGLSESERILWKRLRGHGVGFHCRRQVPVGTYVLDFYVDEAKLAIEVDGDLHCEPERRARDAVRDAYLASRGVETLRVPTSELYESLDAVVEVIYRRCCERVRSRSLSRTGKSA